MSTLLPVALAIFTFGDPEPPAPSAYEIVAAVETVIGDAIAKAEVSVVAISRDKSENDVTLAIRGRSPVRDPNLDRRFGGLNPIDLVSGEVISFDYGAGVVVGGKGQILTAYHVVRGARSLRVRAAGRQFFEAEIIAADPRTDLAVIAPREVAGQAGPKLTPIVIGDSNTLRKGSFLVALGNPFNAAQDGKASASWGILANVARRIEPNPEERMRNDLQLRNYPTLLQLDSKLNLGMSGGAVVNMKGELVGLTTAAANAAGFDAQAGYAIPMDQLGRKVVETLREGKEYEHGFLGVRLDMENFTNHITSADPGTPAGQGGLHVGDAVLAVGDMPVTDSDSLVVAINSIPAGEPVILKLKRDNTLLERTVELAKRRPTGQVIATNRPSPWRGLRVDYTSTITSFGPDSLAAMAREGVVISEVSSGSEAEKAGLKVGQIISRVGEGTRVRNPREFLRAVDTLKGPARLETDQGVVNVK